jgi:hypothetical protein
MLALRTPGRVPGRYRAVGLAQQSLDQDHFPHVVPLEAVPDVLEHVADHEQQHRPPPEVPPPLRELEAAYHERRDGQRNTEVVQSPRAGMLVPLEPVPEPEGLCRAHARIIAGAFRGASSRKSSRPGGRGSDKRDMEVCS